MGGLEHFQRRAHSRPPSEVSRCKELLSGCRAVAEENEERSARAARRARAGLMCASYGLDGSKLLSREGSAQEGGPVEGSPLRRQRSPSGPRSAQPALADAGAAQTPRKADAAIVPRLAIPAEASTAALSTRTWTSTPPQDAGTASAPMAPSTQRDAPVVVGPANAAPPTGQPLAIAFAAQPVMPAASVVVGPGPERRIGALCGIPASCMSPRRTHSVSPAQWARASSMGAEAGQTAAQLAASPRSFPSVPRSISPLQRRAASIPQPPDPRAVPLRKAPVLRAPQSLPGAVSPGPLGAGPPGTRPPQAGDLCSAMGSLPLAVPAVQRASGAQPVHPGFGMRRQGSMAAAPAPAMPGPGAASPAPRQASVGSRSPLPPPPPLVRVAGAGPVLVSREVPLDVTAYVGHALRRQAARQIFACLRMAASRRASRAMGRWWRVARGAASEATLDAAPARSAHCDYIRDHHYRLCSMLSSAEAAEGRKVASHERSLAVLLGLRRLHSCLQRLGHRQMRSSLGRLRLRATSLLPIGGLSVATGGARCSHEFQLCQSAFDSQQVQSASSHEVVPPPAARSPLVHAPEPPARKPSCASVLWSSACSPESLQLPPPRPSSPLRHMDRQSVSAADAEATLPGITSTTALSIARPAEAAAATDAASSTEMKACWTHSDTSSSWKSAETLQRGSSPCAPLGAGVVQPCGPEGEKDAERAASRRSGAALGAGLAGLGAGRRGGLGCAGPAAPCPLAEEAALAWDAECKSGPSPPRVDDEGGTAAEEYSFAANARRPSAPSAVAPRGREEEGAWPSHCTPRPTLGHPATAGSRAVDLVSGSEPWARPATWHSGAHP